MEPDDDSYRCEICGAPVEANYERFCPACEDNDEEDQRAHELDHGPGRLG